MPYRIQANAGKPYQPSNGSEGEMFMIDFCYRCKRHERYWKTGDGKDGCPILAKSFWSEQPEWTHTEDGEPTCTAFEAVP